MEKNITGLFLAACVLMSSAVFAAEFQVNTYTVSHQQLPASASDGTNYLVAWGSNGQDGDSYGVYGQIIDSSGGLVGSEFQINAYTTSNQTYPDVASSGSNYLVTWQSYGQDGTANGVYGRLINSSGGLISNEFRLNMATYSYQEHSSVASSGTTYLVTWHSQAQDGTNYSVYGRIVNSSGGLLGSEFKINTYTGTQQYPSVASDGTSYLVTWESVLQDGYGDAVYGQIVSSSGVLVGSEFQINTYTISNQSTTAIASDGTNYLVTWESNGQDGSSYGVYGRIVDSSGVMISDEFQINTYTTDYQISSSIAFDGTNYLVTWESNGQDGSNYGVYGQFVDPLGDLIGDEFQINTYTTSGQRYSSVASSGTDYLVTWSSDGQDGSGWGVYGDIVEAFPEEEPIPEPSTILLLVSTGLGLMIRRKKIKFIL